MLQKEWTIFESFKILREKIRQAKFRQADFLPDFKFASLLVKVSRQGAMNFFVGVGEEDKFVLIGREDFFQREAVNFGGQIFCEMNFRCLRGDFIFSLLVQR